MCSAMQVPIGTDLTRDMRSEGDKVCRSTISSGFALSMESQLKLREFYGYQENSRTVLDAIRSELSSLESDPGSQAYLKRVSDRLEEFCLEADSWGFNSLYEIASGLQMLLIDSSSRLHEDPYWRALYKGLALLSSLLDQCESDYRWTLAVAEMLDSFNQIGSD
jgi:hypothetical protein